eukprot:CAMPEP_0114492772 /NCGR_PEP_ID=MMETSP0109-20121206/3741_1 /TAXON_ID=29199 /ORGANISM="Chlorarachnion reptans, Strain CCCM449" /LENGTH=1048 /DNA_ID=CAMNT_0001669653 /DNA_START=33 /DNA_END=3179 /DNA_ORIENTATION=-
MLPQIKLEVLGHCQVKSVLILTYLTVVISIVLASFEPTLKSSNAWQHGGPCDEPFSFMERNLTFDFQDCFVDSVPDRTWSETNSSSVWRSTLSFDDRLSLYNAFSLKLRGSRNVSKDTRGDMEFVNATQVLVYGIDGDRALLYNKTLGVHFVFDEEEDQTDAVWLITRSAEYLNLIITYNQYSITWTEAYSDFEILIFFKDCNLSEHLDELSLNFEFGNSGFYKASMGVRTFLQVVSLALLAVWFWHITRLQWKRVLPEHLWLSIFLVAVLLYQDPFYLPMRLYPHVKAVWYCSTSALLASQVMMMMFWMIMVDGMARAQDSHGWGFYTWKIAFGLIFLGDSLMVMIENDSHSQRLSTHEKEIENGSPKQIADNWVLSVGFMLATTMFAVWAVYITISLWVTSRKLGKLPYVSTRFRQLSFRFFIYQSVCIILYHIATYVVVLIESRGVILQNTNTFEINTGQPIYRFRGWEGMTLASTVLLSVYCWLLSIVYLPSRFLLEYSARRKEHKRIASRGDSESGYVRLDSSRTNALESHCIRIGKFSTARDINALKGFSLQTATWLTYFADQAYFDISSVPRSVFTYGQANLPRWFGFRIVKVIRGPSDTHAYVAISHILDSKMPASRAHGTGVEEKLDPEARKQNRLRDYPTVVVAFRGTVSVQNVRTDLDMFSRTELEDLQRSFGFVIDQLKGTPKVHRGFWEAYRCVEEPLVSIVRHICQHSNSLGLAPIKVYCTGHSLGGALATMLSLSLRTQLGCDVEMYNFGSPRVGNHTYASIYDENVQKSFRVVMDGDIITDTPKLCCLYKHVGSEIMLDTLGNFIINPAFVEKTFRGKRKGLKTHSLEVYLKSLRLACRMIFPASKFSSKAMPVYRPLFTPKESLSESDMPEDAFHETDNKHGQVASPERESISELKEVSRRPDGPRERGEWERRRPSSDGDQMKKRAKLAILSTPGPRIGIKPRVSRTDSGWRSDFLHPKKMMEEKFPSPMGTVTIYTVPRQFQDEIDMKVSLKPILIWNGKEYDMVIDNVPEHLDEFFEPRRLMPMDQQI